MDLREFSCFASILVLLLYGHKCDKRTSAFSLLPTAVGNKFFPCPEKFGYFPDSKDCTKYFVCVFGEPLHETCTGGLYFSAELQTCDWPRNVLCLNTEQTRKSGTSFFDEVDDDDDQDDQADKEQKEGVETGEDKGGSSYEFELIGEKMKQQDPNRTNSGHHQQNVTTNDRNYLDQPSDGLVGRSLEGHKSEENLGPESTTPIFDYSYERTTQPMRTTVTVNPLSAHHSNKVNLDNEPQPPSYGEEAIPPVVDSKGGIHFSDGPGGTYGLSEQLPGILSNRDYDRNLHVFVKPINSKDQEMFKRTPSESSEEPEEEDKSSTRRPFQYVPVITPEKLLFRTTKNPFEYDERPSQSFRSRSASRPRFDSSLLEDDGSQEGDLVTDRPEIDHNRVQSSPAPLHPESVQLNRQPFHRHVHFRPNGSHSQVTRYDLVAGNRIQYQTPDAHVVMIPVAVPAGSRRGRGRIRVVPRRRPKSNSNLNSFIDSPDFGVVFDDDKEFEGILRGNINQNLDLPSQVTTTRQPQTQRPSSQSPRSETEDNSGRRTYLQAITDSHREISRNNVRTTLREAMSTATTQTTTTPLPQTFQEMPLTGTLEDKKTTSDFRAWTSFDIHHPHGIRFGDESDEEPEREIVATPAPIAKPVKPVRTSRPKQPTTPTTTTTTTSTTTTTMKTASVSTTPIPSLQTHRRSRPTNKRLVIKPKTTSPPKPPSRPVPVYSTPSPLTSASRCDSKICRLPDCKCGGTSIPENLSPKEVPQIVLLTFDDAVNDLNWELYEEIFNSGRKNPNGCPLLGTFYVSHEWTDYGQVQTLYSRGHEMASHGVTHSFGEKFSKNQWKKEINGQREILHLYGGVKLEDVRGMRAPFLQIGGNRMFEMLHDSNFTYDSSMPVFDNKPPFWPYTLDYGINHECMITPCPSKSFPGVWEVGMVMWEDLRGGRCSMGDACSNPSNEEEVLKMLLKNFERHYKTNRAPFGLFYHSAWFNTAHHRRGFLRFVDEILGKGDVFFTTNWQMIQWMRNPVSVNAIDSFEPWRCDGQEREDRPNPCNHPSVCNVRYQSGSRFMKSCQPCPSFYPWVGNTGFSAAKASG